MRKYVKPNIGTTFANKSGQILFGWLNHGTLMTQVTQKNPLTFATMATFITSVA